MKFTAQQIADILEGEVVGNPEEEVSKLSKSLNLPITCIGKITDTDQINFKDKNNNTVLFNQKGYEHFNES